MTEEEIEIARAFVACSRWKWLPGMLGPDGFRIQEVREDPRGFTVVSRGMGWTAPSLQEDWLPDITDPCTLGGILQLVREARSQPCWLPTCLDSIDEAWVIEPPSRRRQTRYESYVAVLVAALQAAPAT